MPETLYGFIDTDVCIPRASIWSQQIIGAWGTSKPPRSFVSVAALAQLQLS
jgi:hypothetical protein